MRSTSVSITAAFAVLVSPAFAQAPGPNSAPPPVATSQPIGPSTPPPGVPPEVGGPLLPATDTGLDQVASDGVSTRTIPASPCSTAARETDGTTTCVGIPGPVKSIRERDGVTTSIPRP